jgi:serine/threonine protein kinase
MEDYTASAVGSADKRSLLRTFFGCLANGLRSLHNSQIRHSDIKPQNILVQGDRVLWTDFGISLDWEHLSRSTRRNIVKLSDRYCAPEVHRRKK